MSIGIAGGCPQIIQWWLQITRRSEARWPRKSALEQSREDALVGNDTLVSGWLASWQPVDKLS